jgi:hypothetical protein
VTTGASTGYRVTWHLPGEAEGAHTSQVQVIEGYSTTDDIPRIIVTARTGDPSLAYLVTIDTLEAF